MTQEQKRIKIAKAVGKDADYFNDLNAMHEAENWFRRQQQLDWCGYEFMIGKCDTASQRAEAFGKTLNLW